MTGKTPLYDFCASLRLAAPNVQIWRPYRKRSEYFYVRLATDFIDIGEDVMTDLTGVVRASIFRSDTSFGTYRVPLRLLKFTWAEWRTLPVHKDIFGSASQLGVTYSR